MNARAVGMLVLAVGALGWGALRFVHLRQAQRIGRGPPPGYAATWRCRATGFTTNLAPDEVAARIATKRFRADPANPALTLVECPDCGKVELEAATVTPSGVVAP